MSIKFSEYIINVACGTAFVLGREMYKNDKQILFELKNGEVDNFKFKAAVGLITSMTIVPPIQFATNAVVDKFFTIERCTKILRFFKK